MLTPMAYILAVVLGIASTLPLGPSGMSIVSAFALKGEKRGYKALLGLLLAEVIYMAIALALRAIGVLSLSHQLEVVLTLIFSAFLIIFGYKTYKSSKQSSTRFPIRFFNVFAISVMNPTLLIFYMGLIISVEKGYGPNLSVGSLLLLAFFFLSGVMGTLVLLGKMAQKKSEFINNNLAKIKAVLGPIFILLGLSSALSSF